jgi:hypothetical protein
MNQITTATEAETAIANVEGLIEKLHGIVEQETAFVRAGQVRKAAALGAAKDELAGALHTAGQRLKANVKFLQRVVPGRGAALQKLQQALRDALQKNMIVLATSHAVLEGIVRRLSTDLARKASPQVYGSSGRAIAPNPKRAQPLAVSRVL